MISPSFLAIDLGAESGRGILGRIDKRLTLAEVHRFPNSPVRIGDHIHWDILRIWSEVQACLRLAAGQPDSALASIGLDTWGVDFGLLDVADRLIGIPYHYRDARTDGMIEAACRIVPRERIYSQTGIQFMQLNTLFQLFAMRQQNDPALDIARAFLTTPDLLNFWLTGCKANEFTISTTTQCYDPLKHRWSDELLAALNIPAAIFQKIIQPGSILEELRPWVAAEASSRAVPVVAVGCHDTASAVAAVPAKNSDFIYISSGTWSLIGIEADAPIINADSLRFNLTNEGGVGGKTRFLKNIMGMWLLQECRREWNKAGETYSYDDLAILAGGAPFLRSLISVSDPRFLTPGDMVRRIQKFCRETGQEPPRTEGEIVRCILESLALEYRWNTEKLRLLSGKALPVIHIIGGGSRNNLLNQFSADATGCRVIAGPVEATAIGNILMQAIALGHLSNLAEARALVKQSFNFTVFEPGDSSLWEAAYLRYLHLRGEEA
jgi:rhamnulokinase